MIPTRSVLFLAIAAACLMAAKLEYGHRKHQAVIRTQFSEAVEHTQIMEAAEGVGDFPSIGGERRHTVEPHLTLVYVLVGAGLLSAGLGIAAWLMRGTGETG